MKRKNQPKDCQHDFKFYDTRDEGDEVHKIYDCKCGRRRVEVYILLFSREYEVDGENR